MAGVVRRKVTKVHTRHCNDDEPYYEIKSDKTANLAMLKGPALHNTEACTQPGHAKAAPAG